MDTNQGFDELAAIVQVSPVYYQTVIKCYYTLTRNAGCSAIPSKGDKAACSTYDAEQNRNYASILLLLQAATCHASNML